MADALCETCNESPTGKQLAASRKNEQAQCENNLSQGSGRQLVVEATLLEVMPLV